MKFCIYLLFLFKLYDVTVVSGRVAAAAIENVNNNMTEQRKFAQGLYDQNDQVLVLTKQTFRKFVYDRPYASLIEFYNAYCGFCRNFAPHWKAFAEDVSAWQDIVVVGAIDCSADENNDFCREFEVMAYPSVRYYPPYHKNVGKNFGTPVEGQEKRVLRAHLIKNMRNETKTPILPTNWPSLTSVTEPIRKNIFTNLPDIVQYLFIVYPAKNSTIGHEITLDLHGIRQIAVKQIDSAEIAAQLELAERPSLTVVNRALEFVTLPLDKHDRKSIRDSIQRFVSNRGISTVVTEAPADADAVGRELVIPSISDVMLQKQNEALLEKVKTMRNVVFQADIENALKYTLFHEIPSFAEITGERLFALQRFITILNRYGPLGTNGRHFLKEIETYVMEASVEIKGEYFKNKLLLLQNKWSPVFSSKRFVGCLSSDPNKRGFTCGLWYLFHFLTAQAADMELSHDPLEVLQVIHGYVKYFFGCADCSEHFQKMAVTDKIWNVSTKDDAMLWIWQAHNKVNRRLSGDATEDPDFPKIQFPHVDDCTECRRPITSSSSNHSEDVEWDKTEVLLYLKRIYSPQNFSRLGVDDESQLPQTMAALREKRLLENVFNDLDMRMGIFLYFFCICMMIIAVKLFIRRGYRKKMYAHDFLGKV